AYKALYPSVALMRLAAAEVRGKNGSLPFFTTPVIYDVEMIRRIVNMHSALVAPNSALAGETTLLNVLTGLIAEYADVRLPIRPVGQEHSAVRVVRVSIDAHYDQNISLTELARLVTFSPFYLARVFKAEVGIPPHAYLESVRIRHAQRLLIAGD